MQAYVDDHAKEPVWSVDVGMGAKSRYDRRYEFDNAYRAILHFNGFNVHSGGKKRLVHNGRVVARVIT